MLLPVLVREHSFLEWAAANSETHTRSKWWESVTVQFSTFTRTSVSPLHGSGNMDGGAERLWEQEDGKEFCETVFWIRHGFSTCELTEKWLPAYDLHETGSTNILAWMSEELKMPHPSLVSYRFLMVAGGRGIMQLSTATSKLYLLKSTDLTHSFASSSN